MHPSVSLWNDADIGVRAQLLNLYGLFGLSITMFDRVDEQEILRLAASSVASLAPCQVPAAYLTGQDKLTAVSGMPAPTPTLDAAVGALGGQAGPVTVPEFGWAWAMPLPSGGRCRGYLVLGADSAPSDDQQVLLTVLASQTGAAIGNAVLVRENAQELQRLNDRQARLNDQLSDTVATLQQRTRIHEVLAHVAASGAGEEPIAHAVHELSQLPVVVEDRFGNVRAWAGPGRPVKYCKPARCDRDALLVRLARHGQPMREKDRVVALAQSGSEVLGVLSLIDSDRVAGPKELLVLELAATVLAVELAHRRSMIEVELRLRRELVDDLVSGTDKGSAQARAEALGHDLVGPHQVAAVTWHGRFGDEDLAQAVQRAAGNLGLRALVARRAGHVVLIAPATLPGAQLHTEVSRLLTSSSGAVGVGGSAAAPQDYPRSYREAVRAMDIRQRSRNPSGATTFQELGIYRILIVGDDNTDILRFVQEWLGPLLDYDGERHAELVETLHQYLEHGGNYDAAAATLLIHRSTLRYRLQRIHNISGLDLRDVDVRLNLHVATRAWKILEG
jgi:DNA-binding PucR family transcriptional regulator